MFKPDPTLLPEWDDYNINHIAAHGLSPEQVEEVYYGEGPFPTIALKTEKGVENRWNIDIVSRVPMLPDYVSKSLSPPILNMRSGDVLQRFLCWILQKKHTMGE